MVIFIKGQKERVNKIEIFKSYYFGIVLFKIREGYIRIRLVNIFCV